MEHEVLAGLSVPLPALSFEFVPASLHAALASVARLEDRKRSMTPLLHGLLEMG
jgi:hypothetical protein